MAARMVPFPDDRQRAGDAGVVRQDRPQRRNKLRTNLDCLLDRERITPICSAVKIVLHFIRMAELGDLALPFQDAAERLETRAALESAVEELELLREQLYRENLAL